MSETSLEKLTLQTLKAAILSNPRAQNHFRSIGGLEVLLDGIGVPWEDNPQTEQRGDGQERCVWSPIDAVLTYVGWALNS